MNLDVKLRGDSRVQHHWSILEKSLGVLRQGFDGARPHRVACLREVGDEVAVEWLSPGVAAARLRDLSNRAGGLEGFRQLAERLGEGADLPIAGEPPSFDCVVLAEGLVTHFEVSAPDPRQDALDRVADLVATLRGLRAATFDIASAPVGLGYAVRSPSCNTCAKWMLALCQAGLYCAEMSAPAPVPPAAVGPESCSTCAEELSAAEDAARATLQLDPEDVRRASAPEYVLGYLGLWA